MPVTLTVCFVCKEPAEVEVPEAFLEAGLAPGAVLTVCASCASKEHVASGGLFVELANQPDGAILIVGRIAITLGAVAALADSRQHAYEFVERHARGDWGRIGSFEQTEVTQREIALGELATEDSAKQNKIAVKRGHGQVMSSFTTRSSAELWILTTIGTNRTVVMCPEEY
jgi:hypothetical protein